MVSKRAQDPADSILIEIVAVLCYSYANELKSDRLFVPQGLAGKFIGG